MSIPALEVIVEKASLVERLQQAVISPAAAGLIAGGALGGILTVIVYRKQRDKLNQANQKIKDLESIISKIAKE